MNGQGMGAQARRRAGWRTLAALALGFAVWSCDVSESAKAKQYLSLKVPDSLMAYHSVLIVLKPAGGIEALDTLWNDSLSDPAALARLPAPRYPGGDADLVIQGVRNGNLVYEVRVEYRGDAQKPKIVSTLAPDSLAPVMHWDGADSLELEEMPGKETLASLLPKVRCLDDRDRELPDAVPDLRIDTAKYVMHSAAYVCSDRAGNRTQERICKLRIRALMDTTPPVVIPRGPSRLVLRKGDAWKVPEADCVDGRDGTLPVLVDAAINPYAHGVKETLVYSCADRAGNRAEATVEVTIQEDGDKPVLKRIGPDTLVVQEGGIFVDSGAVCTDNLDTLPVVTVSGAVDTRIRGNQTLTYHCVDFFGNQAVETIRTVKVIRVPDRVDPVLTLIGADSLVVHEGQAYADSGAACLDDRDGSLPVKVTGTVDTGIRSLQSLSFQCADSAGNSAAAVRKVLVVRKPDAVRPVVTLKGADSLETLEGQAYTDAGADCADDRDGVLPVTVIGSINTALRALQALAYQCVDSAGNAAVVRTRKVNVVRVPDTVKPVATLRGAPVIKTLLNAAYADAGADCVDDRDGVLPVILKGAVDIGTVGSYELRFACADSAGNAAASEPSRIVKVVASLDSTLPIITRIGPDTLVAVSADGVFDPWATCLDSVSGPLPVTRSALPAAGFTGHVQVTYACRDAALNEATATRTVKIGVSGTWLPADADTQIDTSAVSYNTGGSGTSGFVMEPNGKYFALVRFDHTQVTKAGLKSAKLRFNTFGHGSPWPGTQSNGQGGFGTFADYTFRVYAVDSGWTEGTGNWFYHDGGFRNGGQVWCQNYPMSAAVIAASTNPAVASGITGANRSLVRAENLTLVNTRKLNLFYGDWNGNPNQVPPPRKLTVVEVDVTDYVRSTAPDSAFGFLVKVDGARPEYPIGFTTKELGDGSYAPKLMLEY